MQSNGEIGMGHLVEKSEQ